MSYVDILLTQLDRELPIPAYAHPGDAGVDLYAAQDVVVEPQQRVSVPTGVAIALPDGYAGFVHPRSGMAIKHGLTVVNSPGTIDAGYRGEIRVGLINLDVDQAVTIRRADRIAQLVVQKVETARFHVVDRLPGSVRGSGGFGSTGGVAATSTTDSRSKTSSSSGDGSV